MIGAIPQDKRTMRHQVKTRLAARFSALLLGVVLACMAINSQVLAEENETDISGSEVTVSVKIVESRINEVEASTTLAEDERYSLIEKYRKILGYIETADTYSDRAGAFAEAGALAPKITQGIREKLEEKAEAAVVEELDLAADATAREIESLLQTAKANQAAVAAILASREQLLAAEANRPKVIRERLVEASKLLETLANDIKSSSVGKSVLLAESDRWLLSAQGAAMNAEVRMLDQELLSQSVRIYLLKAQRDAAVQSLKLIEQNIRLRETLLTDKRRSETEQIITATATDTPSFGSLANHPLILETEQQNVELREYLQQSTNGLEQIEAATRDASNELLVVQEDFQSARQRLEIVGLSQVLGQVLHEQRRDLPDLRDYQRRAGDRAVLIAQAGLRDIKLEAERRALQDIPQYVAELVADLPEAEGIELSAPLQELLGSRLVLLKNGIAVNSNYLRALGELDFQENQLLATSSDFNDFLLQRLLWVRNKPGVSLDTLRVLPAEIIEFIDPQPWLEVGQFLFTRLAEGAWLWLAIIIVGGLLWKAAVFRKALLETAKSVGLPASDSFAITLQALGYTILLALPWPLLSVTLGWELIESIDVSNEAKAIGYALFRLSPVLFFMSLFKSICAKGGLAEAHFKWSLAATATLRTQLNTLLLSFLLPVFVLLTTIEMYPDKFGGELARVMFVVATAGLLYFLIKELQPKTGLIDVHLRAQGESESISWLWFVLATVIPVSYAIAALAGYLYSAMSLMTFLVDSLWLVLFLIVVHELASRWLLVVGGKFQLKIATEQRDAALVIWRKQRESNAEGSDEFIVPEEAEIDVAKIDANTRKLLRLALIICAFFGMGAIWSELLPALTILRDFTLWQNLEGPINQQQLVPVTLADILLAVAYIFLAIVATRTIPSLIEAILRQRNTSSGARLAIATLSRYGIAVIGISLVAGVVGFEWGEIQWLVAALGVGIGFGLQEIIANFISGLIILAERPIRVGDVVTVGDASGTVTRLQLRATTVTNFDRQELLVPNKEFITGRVLNWSLSDEVIRLVAKVGVAYGTDMSKALQLVNEAVKENKSILKEPAPLITFDEFGDNSLNIIARCFIEKLGGRREITSELNLAINQKFNAAGVVIAFPQRDVHLTTAAPLDIRIQPGTDTDSSDH
jgi:potassium efflux system protein